MSLLKTKKIEVTSEILIFNLNPIVAFRVQLNDSLTYSALTLDYLRASSFHFNLNSKQFYEEMANRISSLITYADIMPFILDPMASFTEVQTSPRMAFGDGVKKCPLYSH